MRVKFRSPCRVRPRLTRGFKGSSALTPRLWSDVTGPGKTLEKPKEQPQHCPGGWGPRAAGCPRPGAFPALVSGLPGTLRVTRVFSQEPRHKTATRRHSCRPHHWDWAPLQRSVLWQLIKFPERKPMHQPLLIVLRTHREMHAPSLSPPSGLHEISWRRAETSKINI